MPYSDIIKISESFKSSVNIEYDLYNYQKLSNYIPTEDVCEVMKYYINAISDSRYVRSTILEGPYGKGKSYLVLSMAQMLVLDQEDSNFGSFLMKLDQSSSEIYEKVVDMKKKHIKLLPVIINSNYHRLPQALNMALKDALSNIHLDSLFPNTAFEICLNVIDKWRLNIGVNEHLVNKCIEKTGVSLDELERGLREYDSKSYEMFVDLYNCIVPGLEFNPFASDDVVKNYQDIAHRLSEYGYTGLFVIFDEFSKFIEAENDNLSVDLKVLQDLAEAANRSGKTDQLHLCCITHKPLSSYYRNKKETTANSFKTVEGRFNEIRFNRSLNQNYEIISLTLNKLKEFESVFNKFYKEHKKQYDKILESDLFRDVDSELIVRGCFPLNPLTTYAVINVSEKIAQNERTLFTFITDNDTNSLSSFISNNSTGLFSVDKIYDYFANMIDKAEDESIRKINYKVQICLSKLADNTMKSIIKVISIMKIIGDDNYCSSAENIANSLFMPIEDVHVKLNELVALNLLKRSFATNNYDFSSANSKAIDNSVEAYLATKAKKDSISSILNGIYDSEFVLPRKYNTEHSMTRFFTVKYVTDSELMGFRSFDALFNTFTDGLVLNVLTDMNNEKEIKAHFDGVERNELVILRFPCREIGASLKNEILRLNAVSSLLGTKTIDNEVKEEARLILEDEISELSFVLDELYGEESGVYSRYKEMDIDDLTSYALEQVYNRTPIFNIEMMNKEMNVTPQYTKPRNTIVNMYLNKNVDKMSNYSATSPEMTVYNAVSETESPEKRDVLDLIKSNLKASEGKKLCAVEIVDGLKKAPYGLRNGVLPVLFAMALAELDNAVIFYFDTKEIDLNAENINKMVEKPEKYYFSLVEGSTEKNEYLAKIMQLFGITTSNSYREDVKQTVEGLQRWIRSMPRIVSSTNRKNNILDLDEKFLAVKTLFTSFNLNEHETLMNKLPAIFDGNLKKATKSLKEYKKSIPMTADQKANNVGKEIKKLFSLENDESLYNSINDWISASKIRDKVLEDSEKSFVSVFDKPDYDEVSLVNSISKAILKVRITDWNEDNTEKMLDFIRKLVNEAESKPYINDVVGRDTTVLAHIEEVPISSMGKLLTNNIDELMEEFGDSISNEEKITILMSYIKKMM